MKDLNPQIHSKLLNDIFGGRFPYRKITQLLEHGRLNGTEYQIQITITTDEDNFIESEKPQK